MLLEEEWRSEIKKSGSAIEMFELCSTERTREKEDGSYCTEDTSQIDTFEKKWPTLDPFTEIIYRMRDSNLYHLEPTRNVSGSCNSSGSYVPVLTVLFPEDMGSNSAPEP
jgi:hypothetical protein